MQRVGSTAAHDETPQAELDSEQLACNLRAAGRQSVCILPLFCLLGLSSRGPLVVGCKHTGHTTRVEHDKVLPGSLVPADHRHQYELYQGCNGRFISKHGPDDTHTPEPPGAEE